MMRTVELRDLTDSQRRLLKVDPSFVLNDGPWLFSRERSLGIALQVFGVVAGLLGVAWVVTGGVTAVDQGETVGSAVLRRIPLFLLVATFLGYLPFLMGKERRAGRFRLRENGRILSMYSRKVSGDREVAQLLYDGYNDGDLTYKDITDIGHGGWKRDITVRTYLEKKTDTAFATVSLDDGDRILVWPPVAVSPLIALATMTGKRYPEYEWQMGVDRER